MLWEVDRGSSRGLSAQIADNVRRGIAEGTLAANERLPPAAELAHALAVNPNTVLAAYRALRAEGLLEFRRGRGVRVRPDVRPRAVVRQAVHQLLELGRAHGYTPSQLAELLLGA
jgi:GntR family transcriptional regulator